MSARPSRLNWPAYRLAREAHYLVSVDALKRIVTCACGWSVSGLSSEASHEAFADHCEDAVIEALHTKASEA